MTNVAWKDLPPIQDIHAVTNALCVFLAKQQGSHSVCELFPLQSMNIQFYQQDGMENNEDLMQKNSNKIFTMHNTSVYTLMKRMSASF